MFKLICPTAAAGLMITALAGVMAAAPAAAQNSCDAWDASVAEREEGKALTASVCAPGKDRDSVLEVVCHGERVNIRYLAVIENDAEPKFQKQDFIFNTGTARRRVFMQYEGLDGAFTAYLAPSHPLFDALMSGSRVEVAATKDKLRAPNFALKGSRRAISQVISKCR